MSAYLENRYTVYRSFVLKNNSLGTVNIIFINKIQFLIFSFFFFFKLVKCMGSMFPCYSLLNMKVIWLYMVSAPLPLQWGDLIWKFAKILWWQNFFLHLWQDKPPWVELKIYGGVILITILLHFRYLFSLETANPQKSEVFLLRIYSGNVNASVVTCQYSQIYNFSFRKEFLETLCKCIYLGFYAEILKHFCQKQPH